MIHYYDPHQIVSINHVFENSTIWELESTMKTNYSEIWKNLLRHSPKLSFYETFKEFYEEEKYLDTINNFDQRQHFTKLRISNHKLAIETRRYSNPKTPREQRYCLLCNNNKIETEQLMIFECPTYSNLRKDQQSYLKDKFHFSVISNITSLMKSKDDEVIFYLSKFIWKCFLLRKEKLSDG